MTQHNLEQEAEMSETAAVPPLVTSVMKFLLRSPAHGVVSKMVLLITFTGRKSGKTYTTPVDYSQDGDQVFIFTHANWWKNLRGGAPVTLRLRGREVHGMAEPVADDKQAVAAGLTAHLRKVPSDAKYYAVALDERGNPSAEDIELAVQKVVMIRVRLA
jgi:deazaflavin-dependent oxidoreductase (nitroreductase family)